MSHREQPLIDETTCGVCLKPKVGTNRVGGLGICDTCLNGGAEKAAAGRGWQLASRSWTTGTGRNTWYHCEAKGVLPGAPEMKAKFKRKVGGLFAAIFSIKTDDPLFNQSVDARSKTKEIAQQFLEDDGAQSAIMDLVGERAKVKIDGENIVAHAAAGYQYGDPPSELRVLAETAVLMAHLAKFSERG